MQLETPLLLLHSLLWLAYIWYSNGSENYHIGKAENSKNADV